ncbi:hypothetical protein [Streptacidiphilus sp. MAP5-3]|uniref:hypothetical protein n=1 Tax=unclassified Streptacidiphilus TaxID=2643834 RepID=UPI0035149976
MPTDATDARNGRRLTADASVVAKLGAEPGLCAACAHVHLNETRRGTAYLRCTRAAWDARLPRYPRLPVLTCSGFEQGSS